MKFTRLSLCALAIASFACKTNLTSVSETEALSTNLKLQSSYSSVNSGTCLVELEKNFAANTEQSVGTSAQPQCIPVNQVEWRGRLDVESQETSVKDVRISLVVDNSASLKQTDPTNLRFSAIDAFLDHLDKVYANKKDAIQVQVVFFSYCATQAMYSNQLGGIQNLKKEIRSRISSVPAGATNYLDALKYVKNWLGNSAFAQLDKHMVLFSDGMPFALSGQIGSQCKVTVAKTKTIASTKDAVFADCGSAQTPSQCAEPAGKDLGFVTKKAVWDDPTNYAVGLAQHSTALQNFRNESNVTLHSVFLNQGCYEYNAAKQQGDAERAGAFLNLCNNVAPAFFKEISNGTVTQIKNAANLKDAFLKVSNTLTKQISFNEFRYQMGNQWLLGRAYVQDQDKGSYNFALPSVQMEPLIGKMAVEAVGADGGGSHRIGIPYAFKVNAAGCNEFSKVTEANNTTSVLLQAKNTAQKYTISCRVPAAVKDCTTLNGVKVTDGYKETVPGYSKQYVQANERCEDVIQNRTRECRAGQWTDWAGGKYTNCSVQAAKDCNGHPHGSTWEGDKVKFQSDKVANIADCRTEKDKFQCDNGVVKQIYKTNFVYDSCSATTTTTSTAMQNCGNTAHGAQEAEACYRQATGTECPSYFRVCNNGNWQPSDCPYRQCQIISYQCVNDRGERVAQGTQENRVKFRTPNGTCDRENQARICQTGQWSQWSGSYIYDSCTPDQNVTNPPVTNPPTNPTQPVNQPNPESEVAGEEM